MKQSEAKVAELAAQRDPWEAPDFLRADARKVWREVVDGVSADHFAEGDRAVLARFCQCEARCRKLANEEAKRSTWITDAEERRAHRALVAEIGQLRSTLSTLTRILRLGPSSRAPQKTQRTDMPTRNPAKAKRKAGDDLFSC
jgi:phage terminase small subunit